MAKESAFVAKLQRWLVQCRRHPIWHFRTHQAGRTKAGIPDLLIVFYGYAIFIECKAPGGKATAIQLQRIKELTAAGATAIVATTVAEVRDAMLTTFNRERTSGVPEMFAEELPPC